MTSRLIMGIFLAATSGSAQPGRVTYISPDHQLRAVAVPAKRSSTSSPTRYLDIYKADGSLTGREGGSVTDLQHPPRVSGAWSPDLQFFVYNVTRRAPSRPATVSTLVYVRKNEYQFYDLRQYLPGVIAIPKWSFHGRSSLRGQVVTPTGTVRPFDVDLSKIAWQDLRRKKT
jgi:hypothetical protein